MKQQNNYIVLILLIILLPSGLRAQIKGVVTDSLTNEPLPYISVFYDGKGVGAITDENGKYTVETRAGWNELSFSAVGYVGKTIKIRPGVTKELNVQLMADDIQLQEVVIRPQREKYSRKNNPAVDLMRQVIAHKSEQKLEEYDFYQYRKYQKITLSLNDITPSMFETGVFKKMSFLQDQIEVSEETNKLIIPISVQENVSRKIYRKEPRAEKTIVEGISSNGIDELLSTGDMLGPMLQDVFTDVNIYDNDIRLLQSRFVSPISSASAISFYKYYIMDTVYVDRHECIHLSFVPQNSQDFGFTGHLYILNDSSYAVKKCTMNLPKKTGVNFVDNLSIIQEFEQLPTGEWILKSDDMLAELYLVKALQGVLVKRTTKYSGHDFEPLSPQLFRLKGSEIKEADAMMKSDEYWAEVREVPLTRSESSMDILIKRFEQMPGFTYILFVARAFIENFVETGTKEHPSKVDIGPINTMITSNFVDGLRLRASAQTTANLHPQIFLKGYYAYGFKDKRSKYKAEVEYSFDKKEYLPREFPKHSIAVSYQYDVMSPMDKFLKTDKDNVFVSWKATTVDQMSYVRNIELKYERETHFGLTTTLAFKNTNDEPTANLHFVRNDGSNTELHDINTSEASVYFRYAPGETFVNTKQRRVPVSLDAPVFTLSHTAGFKALGGDYTYNLTEAGVSKRFWLSSWGRVDASVKVGAQWNKVPFPLLIMPEANLSYITQRGTFSLINNMEFLNDRYASLMVSYNMNGKLLNRIPLIKKLKWREYFSFKMLSGQLTDKNNPFMNPLDGELFVFPKNVEEQFTSYVMDPKVPYMEASVGIHNIFKIIHVEYVRRLNYLDHPGINKHGIRVMMMMTF